MLQGKLGPFYPEQENTLSSEMRHLGHNFTKAIRAAKIYKVANGIEGARTSGLVDCLLFTR